VSHTILDPETQFLGRVMWLDSAPARRALSGMSGADFSHPIAALVAELAMTALADDLAPAPTVLFGYASEHSEGFNEQRLSLIGEWIVSTYQSASLVGDVDYLKGQVLLAAWRREIAIYGTRLNQAAHSSRSDTVRDLLDNTGQLDNLWKRCEATHNPSKSWGVAA
jgi:hypothetical protein